MLLSSKGWKMACLATIVCCFVLYVLFHWRVPPRTWELNRISPLHEATDLSQIGLTQGSSLFPNRNANKNATDAIVELKQKSVLDNLMKSIADTLTKPFTEFKGKGASLKLHDPQLLAARDAGDPSEKMEEGNRSLTDPGRVQCNGTRGRQVQGTLTALNRSALPPDLTYMHFNSTCKHYEKPNGKNKLILDMNPQGWVFPKAAFKGCAYDACNVTDDRSLLSVADAVFVTVCRLNIKIPPPRPSAQQIWIAFGLESPVHFLGFHNSPAWRNVFNWTMTYRTDSDVFCPYGLLTARSASPTKNYTDIALRKTRPIAWLVSNCHTHGKRELYVRKLQKYIDVDIYGGCSNKKCPKGSDNVCLQNYYFYLAFENSICEDYVTEKFFKLFNNINIVPIVRGGADYSRYFPPGTYLNTADYPSPQQLATHVKTLMADRQAYARLLETKDHFTLPPTSIKKIRVCKLCEYLHISSSKQSKVYPDFMKWINKRKCRNPTDI